MNNNELSLIFNDLIRQIKKAKMEINYYFLQKNKWLTKKYFFLKMLYEKE